MTRKMKWKLLAYWAVYFVVSIAVFGLACGFTFRATAVLSFLCSLFLLDRYPPKQNDYKWSPFMISFEPDFAKMLHDLGLLDDPGNWETLLSQRSSVPLPQDDFERSGAIRCVVLSPETEDANQILVWGVWTAFRSQLECTGTLSSVVVGKRTPEEVEEDKRQDRVNWDFSWSPDFFIRLGDNAAYDFGLRVKKEWWNSQRENSRFSANVLEERECDHDWACGTIHLVLGRFPYWEMFRFHYLRSSDAMIAFWRPEHEQKRTESLKPLGWSILKREYSEIPRPETFIHRYMSIWHDHL